MSSGIFDMRSPGLTYKLAPERRQRRQAYIAGARHDAQPGQRFADLTWRAHGWSGIDASQPEQTLEHALPAIVLVGVATYLDRARLVDACLRLGDTQRQLQATQLVDQTGALGVDAT